MITAVYLKNPFKPQSRIIKALSCEEAPTLKAAADILGVESIDGSILVVNGQKAEPRHELKPGDFVVIAPNVLGGGGGGGSKNVVGLIAGIALMAMTGGAGAGLLGMLGTTQGMLGMGLALYFGGSLMMGNQKMPKIDSPKIDGAFEGGYGWSPNTVRIQPGGPLPLTYGTIKTSGQLIARQVVAGMVTGRWTQILEVLLAAGEGPLDNIEDIEINSTPLLSISGASAEARLGLNNQTAIARSGLAKLVEQISFSVVLENDVNGLTWATKAMTEPGESVRLDFVMASGAYAVDTSSGATIAVDIWMQGQYREVGSITWLDLYTMHPDSATILGSFTQRKPAYTWKLFTPPDKTKLYEFRFQNYTLRKYRADGQTWTSMPANYSADITWASVTVINYTAPQVFPGVALVALQIPASQGLSGSMPKISWKQTRANIYAWNPTAGAYQQKPATNLAWIVYDLIHQCKQVYNIQTSGNEYVVYGEPKENLNYTEFNAWATFCAEESEGVARGVGNLLVDSADQMWPAIQKIAATGRAFVIQQAGVFKPVWDSTRTMSQIFTAGNIIDGSMSGGFLSDRERATAIEASFINEDNGYERDTILVTNDDYSPAGLDNPTQIFIPGLTDPKAVYMLAKHMLKKNQYLRRTLSFQAGIDSIVAEIGDVVGVQSDVTAWGVGGRVMGSTTTSLVIDQNVTLEPGTTYTILIRSADNVLIRHTVDAVVATVTRTTLYFTGDPFDAAPARYSVYSFGVENLETKPFQITGIRRNGDLQATIELIEYIEDVYTEATDFPVIDYTAVGAGISSLTVRADSDTGKLGIAWSIPPDKDYSGAIVYVDGKPQGFFTTEQDNVEIEATPGGYVVRVVPVDGRGREGTGVEEEVTLGNPVLAAVDNITLTSAVRQQADGTALVFIGGTFDIPTLATSVLVEIGEGAEPESWTTIQDCRVPALSYGPVKPGTIYALRFTAKNRYAVAETVEDGLTTTGDTTPPGQPSISATSYLKNVSAIIALGTVPSDLAGFQIFRHTANNSALASLITSVSSKDGRAEYHEVYQGDYGDTLYYWAKAFDTWGNVGEFSAAAGPLTIAAIEGADIVDAALNRSELFAAGVVDATAIGAGAVTAVKTSLAAIDSTNGELVAGAVTELKLANDAVTAAKLNVAGIDGVTGAVAAGAVAELQLASAAVTEAKIATAAVNTAQINNAALKNPVGAVASWSAKNCTTASIAEVGGVRDVSGNGNHGSTYNSVTVVDTEIGKAFDFDGVSGYISTPVNLFSGTSSANPASLSLFIKHDSTQAVAAGQSIIFGQAYYTGFGLSVQNGRLRAFFRNSVSTWQSNIIGVQDAWQHIAVVWGGQSDPKVYVYLNGTFIQTLTVTYADFDSSMDSYTLRIASAYPGGGSVFTTLKGQVAHPKAFNRALTAAEAKSLYMFPEDAAFGNITADLLTTGELITKTAQIKDAIISSAKISDLSADKINAGTLAAARIAANSLAANKITGGAIVVGGAAGDVNAGVTTVNGGKITADTISASKLTVVARELVNPVSVTGHVRGWCNVQEDGSGTSSAVSYDATENAIKITTDGRRATHSQTFLVDPNKIYRIACSVKKSAAHGTYYISLNGYGVFTASADLAADINGDKLFTPYSVLRAAGAPVSNLHLAAAIAGHTSYVEYVLYLIGANRSIDDVPAHLNGTHPYAKAAADVKFAAIRLVNWANTVPTSLFVKNISVTEIGTGQIVGENIVAGTITAAKIKTGELVVAGGAAADVNAGATTISGGKITASSVTASQMAADSILAASIKAGEITGAKMAAGTITARELLIGKAGAALNDDPNFEDASAWGTDQTNPYFSNAIFDTVTDGQVGITVLRNPSRTSGRGTKLIPIDITKTYRVRVWIRALGGSTTTDSIGLRCYNGAGTYLGSSYLLFSQSDTDWEEKYFLTGTGGNADFPVGTKSARLYFYLNSGNTAGYSCEIQDLRIEEALPATLIKDGAIVTDKLAANCITAGKILAGEVQTAALDANCVTADKIVAGAIQTTKLTVLVNNLVNPVSQTGTLNGWGNILEDGTGTSSVISYDATEKALEITNNSSYGVRCKTFLVDPNRIYRISGRIKKSAANGIYEIGLAGFSSDTAGSESAGNQAGSLNFIPYSAARAAGTALSNFYFMGNPAAPTTYANFTLFLLGANRNITEAPNYSGSASTPYAKCSADKPFWAAIRFLNWSNTATTSMFIQDFTVSEVGGGEIIADNVKTGKLQSLNYSTTAGSMIDLDAGDVKMGGSSAPRFSFTNSTNTGVFAGFTFNATDLTAGTGATAIGISTDTSKKAFWAGHATPGSAPFQIAHNGTAVMAGMAVGATGMGSPGTEVFGAKASVIGMFTAANDSMGTTLDTGSSCFLSLSFVPGPLMNSMVRIAATGYYDGSTTDKAHIKIVAESSADYAIDTNGKIQGDCVDISDERLKSDIVPVSTLDKLKSLSVTEWHYDDDKIKIQAYNDQVAAAFKEGKPMPVRSLNISEIDYKPKERHIGPMAADFNRLFGICDGNERGINLSDGIGVALRAIQELAEIVDDLKAENKELRAALNLPEKQKKQKTAEFTAEEIEKAADGHVKAAYDNIMQELKR